MSVLNSNKHHHTMINKITELHQFSMGTLEASVTL